MIHGSKKNITLGLLHIRRTVRILSNLMRKSGEEKNLWRESNTVFQYEDSRCIVRDILPSSVLWKLVEVLRVVLTFTVFFSHFLSNESCITQVCVHNSFLNQHSIFLIIWPCVVRSEVLRYADLIVAVSSSLRSNILYISRRREIGGKNQCLSECKCDWLVGYVSTLHDWRN